MSPDDIQELRTELMKKAQKRVPFGSLVENGLIKPGSVLRGPKNLKSRKLDKNTLSQILTQINSKKNNALMQAISSKADKEMIITKKIFL